MRDKWIYLPIPVSHSSPMAHWKHKHESIKNTHTSTSVINFRRLKNAINYGTIIWLLFPAHSDIHSHADSFSARQTIMTMELLRSNSQLDVINIDRIYTIRNIYNKKGHGLKTLTRSRVTVSKFQGSFFLHFPLCLSFFHEKNKNN